MYLNSVSEAGGTVWGSLRFVGGSVSLLESYESLKVPSCHRSQLGWILIPLEL